ncbi:class I SAM-dependent methyltransferase [Desulfococcaceae bacterium HSG8]|nr:class I SAM-dependent methyltransferase [Desulfococcaceae bacterium HSG8]
MPGWQELWRNLMRDITHQVSRLGHEQIYNPGYSIIEKAYIALFGMPIIGLRIRARNVFSLIPGGRKYKRILDAGSGSGVFSFELGRRFPEADVLGIDPLKKAVNSCTHIADKIRAANVSFRQISVEQLPEQNAFDLILCVDILEHIEDDLAALKSLYGTLESGGILVLHVPSLYRRYPIWKKSLNFDVETHVRTGYEPGEIQEKVRQVGFSIRESGFTYGFFETLANNLSYMITRARMQNKILYSFAFPFLNLISLLGIRSRPNALGAAIFVVADKDQSVEQN